MLRFLEDIVLRVGHVLDWFGRWLKPGGVNAPDMDRIEANLWLGGFVAKWPVGITAILNVAEEDRDPRPPEAGGITCHVRLFDFPPAPGPESLHSLATLVKGWRAEGEVILVHCDAGLHRSAMVICAYLMCAYGVTMPRAVELVAAARQGAMPHDFQRDALRVYQFWLANQPAKPKV